MSYKEKSIWASFFVLIYLWCHYFLSVNALQEAQSLTTSAINTLLFIVVVKTIFLEVILQTIIAIIDYKQLDVKEDERDKLISLYANRNAYWLLSLATPIAVFYTVIPTLSGYLYSNNDLPNEYIIMQLLIIVAVCAEVLRLGSQLFYYRVGS